MNTDHDLSPEERRIARSIGRMAYRTPPEDFTQRVMARITPRVSPWRRVADWLLTPRPLRVAPLWPMAALAGGVALLGFFAAGQLSNAPVRVTADRHIATDPQTVNVEFSIRIDGAKEVALIGSFNNWQSSGYRLSPASENGLWTISVPLARGRHEYAFVLDGSRFVSDPEALLRSDDGFGNVNSIIEVDDHDYAHQHQL